MIQFSSQPELAAKQRHVVALLAPGTTLRDGLQRIQHGHTGALIVLGCNEAVESICTGGFDINTDCTATALRELAKLDGAIILTNDLEKIQKAGVHLVPDGLIPTIETGTRHRTADRVSQQTSVPVVTVSASMSTISLFLDGIRSEIHGSEYLLTRASQALDTLSRYHDKLNKSLINLSYLEVTEQVTVRDVVIVAQRLEMVRRIETEIRGLIAALGVDGKLVELQLLEILAGVNEISPLLEEDYSSGSVGGDDMTLNIRRLSQLDNTLVLDLDHAACQIGFPAGMLPDTRLVPRGYRLLHQVPRMTLTTARRLVDSFSSLQDLLGASQAQLCAAGGITTERARMIQDGLARLTESISDTYQALN